MRGKLYKSNASPPAMAVMMVADILKMDLDLLDLNPVLREQDTPEFKQKNPMRTIPILEEGDFCLADSHAIITYLVESCGKANHAEMYPRNLRKRAVINQRLYFECGILFPRLRAIMEPTFLGKLTGVSEEQAKKVNFAYRILEDYLSKSQFIADDIMTVADVSMLPTVAALNGLCPIDSKKYSKLMNWLNTLSRREFFIKIGKPGCEELVRTLKLLMESNKTSEVKSKI